MTGAEDIHHQNDDNDTVADAARYTHVRHRHLDLDGLEVFYRECGPPDAPLVVLPHGYPCSSFEFRNLMPLLGDRWRLLAPDFPASGFSATPADFDYTFGGFAAFLDRFLEGVGVPKDQRFALYLHDFGTWIGLKLAMRRPGQLSALIVQNGDIYEDALGDKYDALLKVLALPEEEALRSLRSGMVREEWEREFKNGVPEAGDHAQGLPPELLALHWQLATERRKDIQARVILGWKENFGWFPRQTTGSLKCKGYVRDPRQN
ncbi:MAG: alpha/beta fold hydrolase [Alcaligenaceae bacterium]|nr:MAG: alpha/beta fold hydrolase [Alcaligenaceae bacterium]